MKVILTILFFLTLFNSSGQTSGYVLTTTDGSPILKSGVIDDSLLKNNIATSKIVGLGNALNSKQDALVSGTNIKTINGSSILGSGNIVIGGSATWGAITGILSDQTDLQTALNGKLATDGNGSSLTGLTAAQVGLGNVTNESKATMFTNPAFTGSPTASSLAATGNISSSGGSIGYAAGNGGAVTQNANKSQAVTINKLSGQITMNNAALAAAAEVAFTVNNTTVAATDVVVVNIQSVGTAGSYLVSVGAVANGSFSITLSNASGGSLSQAVVLNFIVLKGVAN